MGGVSGGWVLRPFSGAADHVLVEALWLAALEGRWPLLPQAIAMVRDGFFAVEAGGRSASWRWTWPEASRWCSSRPGTSAEGSALTCSAPPWVGCGGRRSSVHAGSGGTDCIWPGVPADLPEAGRLFAACGWQAGQTPSTWLLTCRITGLPRSPPGAPPLPGSPSCQRRSQTWLP